MFGVSTATAASGSRAARHVIGAIFAAMALLIMGLAFGGEAQACPPGTKADSARSLAHKITKAAAVKAQVAAATSHTAKTPVILGACCGGSHAGGSTCQAACSFCTVALAATSGDPLLPADATVYGLSGQDVFPAAQAPPQFRPPRCMA